MAALRRRLDEATIDLAEAEAKMALLEKAFKDASDALNRRDQLERKKASIDFLKQTVADSAKELRRLQAQQLVQGVSVTLIPAGVSAREPGVPSELPSRSNLITRAHKKGERAN